MSGADDARDPTTEARLDLEHEFDLVRSAVALLANGGATRVSLIGLVLDGEALREVAMLVRASGMIMRAVPGTVGCDIAIEASG